MKILMFLKKIGEKMEICQPSFASNSKFRWDYTKEMKLIYKITTNDPYQD